MAGGGALLVTADAAAAPSARDGPSGPGLAAALAGDGDPRHALMGLAAASASPAGPRRTAALGRARMDPDRPMSPDAPARVASISKHVTAIGLLQLWERGRLGLLDDASDHLGFALRHPGFPGAPITVGMLLSHTSGIRNGPSYPVPFGHPLSAAFTPGGAHWDDGGWWSAPSEPPGWFTYADANFACIAQIIERLSGERFDRYMSGHVLRPLGLDAGFNWSGVSQSGRSRAAALYRKGADETRFRPEGPWVAQLDAAVRPAPAISVARAPEAADRDLETYRVGENGFVFSPQGGLRISVNDLVTLGLALAAGGGALLAPQTIALMRTPVWRLTGSASTGRPYGAGQILAYGLGTCVLTGAAGPSGDDLFGGCAGWSGHLGDAYGLVSGLWTDPSGGRVMAYLVNGVSSPQRDNPGRRSAFTWQEEAVAAAMTAR